MSDPGRVFFRVTTLLLFLSLVNQIQKTLEEQELNIFCHICPEDDRRWISILYFRNKHCMCIQWTNQQWKIRKEVNPVGTPRLEREEQAPRKFQNTDHHGVFRAISLETFITEVDFSQWWPVKICPCYSLQGRQRETRGKGEERKSMKRRGCFSDRHRCKAASYRVLQLCGSQQQPEFLWKWTLWYHNHLPCCSVSLTKGEGLFLNIVKSL